MASRDLTSFPAIVTKGILFIICSAASLGLLLVRSPSLTTAILLSILVWTSARSYYFLFYVLHQYVDPSLRYSGLLSLVRALRLRSAARMRPGDQDVH